MGVITINHNLGWGPAETLFPSLPIHPTLPGTQPATLEDAVGFSDPLNQLPFLLQFFVCWAPPFCFLGHGVEVDGGEEQRAAHEERTSDEIPACDFHTGTSVAQSARVMPTSKANWNSGLEDSNLIFFTIIGS
jgi:hypothetical protein